MKQKKDTLQVVKMINHKGSSLLSCVFKATTLSVVFSLLFSLCSCAKNNNDFDGTRFAQTRHITVLVDSYTESETDYSVDSSLTAQYIREAVLRDCNIDVHFMESSKLNFQYGVSIDISYLSDYNLLNTYYRMNSIVNIAPYLDQYSTELSDLTDLLGDENVYSCTDDPSEVWYLSKKDFEPDSMVTFIRRDWLEKLGLDVPDSREELHDCLLAFRDNADILLGDDSSNMIPFFVDDNPGISAKPLFDSCLDTAINNKEFYENGCCRVTQDGYRDGLEILNEWYLQGLLPKDYQSIRPNTKEAYEPIENGYVGAFCAKYDYLYANGDRSHIKAFHEICGDESDYIAVNTFENSYGVYTSWQEDYLSGSDDKVFLPSTCSDPLACLVYLNWISKSDNISAIHNINSGSDANDPFDSDRYLITCQGFNSDAGLYDVQKADQAKQTAFEVQVIQRGNKCVRYNESIFEYINSEIDIVNAYPDSTRNFICSVVSAPEGDFDAVYNENYDDYLELGALWIVRVRENEWDNVVNKGIMLPR